jgi:hypothetical protein
MPGQSASTRTTAFVFGLGVGALGIALVAALYSIGIDGNPDHIIVQFGEHVVGGPTQAFVARVIAFAAGAAGVVCVLRTWKDVRRAGRRSPDGY